MEHLNVFQKEILQETLTRKSGGLCLPMGTGKTLISLVMGIHKAKDDEQILIIVSKTLVESWVYEIEKFFKGKLQYCVFHQDYKNSLTDLNACKIIITTPEMTRKQYIKYTVSYNLIEYQANEMVYITPNMNPFKKKSKDTLNLYSKKWGCIVVDELQNFTNILSDRCRSIISLCSDHKWGLSGTMFSEPAVERILGYHMFIDPDNFPNSLPRAKAMIKNKSFRGLDRTIVYRDKNQGFNPPEINNVVVNHDLSNEERMIYLSMKNILEKVSKKIKKFKDTKKTEMAKKFRGYMFSMLIFLRQSVICPLIPISNITLDMADMDNNSILSKMIYEEITDLNINAWLNDEKSVCSSRIISVLDTVDIQPLDKKIIIFTNFRSCLNVINNFLPKQRQVFSILSEMSGQKRQAVLDEFQKSSGGILTLTYQIGSEGLNLQYCDTMLLVDYWWNSSKTDQAVARILRTGQMSKQINVYYFTSNTGVEACVFEKHKDKKSMIEDLRSGPTIKKVKTIKIDSIISMIDHHDNINCIENLMIK